MLNALDREVFVVTGVDFEWNATELGLETIRAGYPAFLNSSISSTARTTLTGVGSIGDTNVIASVQYMAAYRDVGVAGPFPYNAISEQMAGNTPPTNLDYIAIIATSDFFINSLHDGNLTLGQDLAVRVWGYRASVDGSTYAALVQSQVLSS